MKNKIKQLYDKLSNFLAGVLVMLSIGLPVFTLVMCLLSLSVSDSLPEGFTWYKLVLTILHLIGGIKLNKIYTFYKEKQI